jgi:perosamine synthetase
VSERVSQQNNSGSQSDHWLVIIPRGFIFPQSPGMGEHPLYRSVTVSPAADASALVEPSLELADAEGVEAGSLVIDRARFVCKRSESLLSTIEKCLDNGTGHCFIVDDEDVVFGRIMLEEIASAILNGTAPADLMNWPITPVSSPETRRRCVTPVLDAAGRLIAVRVDRVSEFVQVSRPHLGHAEFRAVLATFLSSWISSRGPHIAEFEEAFAAFVGTQHGIAVTSGTAALHLALLALGIGAGDEVIVPDLTFAATINAVCYCGAKPVIVDVDPVRWTMSPETIEPAITSRTKAIIPVHLYGRPAAMTQIAQLAQRSGIFIVEDCAEAHGARHDGRNVGQFGDVSCFSFYGNKPATTGEGGMCVTNSDALATKIRRLRSHGMVPDRWYWHEAIGFNYRMTNLQAAIGLEQIATIPQTLERNDRLLRKYRERLAEFSSVRFPPPLAANDEPITWLVCVQVPVVHRAAILATARERDIELRPFFTPLTSMPIYREYLRDCPHSAGLAATGLNLPTSDAVDDRVIEKIAGVFRDVLT